MTWHVTLYNSKYKHLWQKHQSYSTTLRTHQILMEMHSHFSTNVLGLDYLHSSPKEAFCELISRPFDKIKMTQGRCR